jgi:hypothetical protein
MLKQINLLCVSLCTIFSGIAQGDLSSSAIDADSLLPSSDPDFSYPQATNQQPFQEPTLGSSHSEAKKEKANAVFHPFTGKIKGKKVRLRLQPDVESAIVKELYRGEYLAVVEDAEDFWAVQAPTDFKAYVFRSFILDHQVEGNRVNVRLQPNMESPILTHLNSGEFVDDVICPTNNKWVEISAPATTRFYVAKNYVENVGGPEVKIERESRERLAKHQLEVAEHFAEMEMQKSYPSIDFDKISHNFQMVIQEQEEFPDLAERSKELFSKIQEQFLDKRISYLENKTYEEEDLTLRKTPAEEYLCTDKMKLWEPVEEALYLTWSGVHESKNMDEYYEDQKIAAAKITGFLEPYQAPVKCKPGDYILKQNDLPVGYVYSTKVNLQHLIGKKVTLIGAPRPNNNFAFPAYFILDVEQ